MSTNLDAILTALLERHGSDLHLKAGRPPLFRISGSVVPSEFEPLSNEDLEALLGELLTPVLRERFDRELCLDFSFMFGESARFRGNAYHQRGQVGAVLRAVPLRVPTLDQLALPAALKDIALAQNGLVLVTGPTGSGKSTTLAAMIEHINANRQAHVVTIEDPVEFVYADHRALISQREIGTDEPDFPTALRHVLRQDPDVILIGEMRDAETIATAVTAAETGHLVLSTLHTVDATQTVDRIIDAFAAEQQRQIRLQLAQVLRAVVCQRLVPMASRATRIAACEVMTNSPSVQKHIVDGDTVYLGRVIEESGGFYRMQTLNQSLAGLVKRGAISVAAAEAASSDADGLHRFLRVAGVDTLR
jgi:twitching motility protein PilT